MLKINYSCYTVAATLIAIFTALFMCADSTNASTNYISNAGSDSNIGTKSSPFAHDPRGPLFTGSWSHSTTNDQFIYHGNDVWTTANFPLTVANAGKIVAGVTWVDYTGVDKTWYSGGSWGQPIWNAGGVPIATGGNNRFVLMEDDNEVFDNICTTNFYWDVTSQGFGCSHVTIGAQTNVQFWNWKFVGWSHDTTNNLCADNMGVLIGSTSVLNPGCLASNCLFDGAPFGTDSGGNGAGYCFPSFINCIVRNMSDGIQPNGNSLIVGNVISNINKSFSNVHGAAIEPAGPDGNHDWHGNLIRLSAEINCFWRPGIGANGTLTFYNNIICDSVPGALLLSALHSTACSAKVWNSAFDTTLGGSYAILVEDGAWASLTDQNDIFITGTVTTGSMGSITSHTEDHTVSWSSATATANGFTSGNLYYNPANSAVVSPGTSAPSSIVLKDFLNNTINWATPYVGPYFYGTNATAGIDVNGNGLMNINGGNLLDLNGQ